MVLPLPAQAVASSPREASKMAEDLIHQMESLVVHDLPRVAETFSSMAARMEGQLRAANAELEQLRARLADLDEVNARLRNLQEDREARIEDLEEANLRLERQRADDEARIRGLAEEKSSLERDHAEAMLRIQAVEQFMKAFPRV